MALPDFGATEGGHGGHLRTMRPLCMLSLDCSRRMGISHTATHISRTYLTPGDDCKRESRCDAPISGAVLPCRGLWIQRTAAASVNHDSIRFTPLSRRANSEDSTSAGDVQRVRGLHSSFPLTHPFILHVGCWFSGRPATMGHAPLCSRRILYDPPSAYRRSQDEGR